MAWTYDTPWRYGIGTPMEIEQVAPSKLKAAEWNPRKHPPKGIAKIVKSIEAFGFTNPILVQRGTNVVIAGHGRLSAARRLKMKKVPVVFLDLDETKSKAYNIADNRLQEESSFDFSALADLLLDLDAQNIDMELTGFDLGEIEEMMNWTDSNAEEQGRLDEKKKEICPKCGHEFAP